jgi:hypothetical protein
MSYLRTAPIAKREMPDRSMLDSDKVAELECCDLERYRALSIDECSELLAAACRDAAEIEASRIRMGMPPSQPAPWPESTLKLLQEASRRVRGRQ